MVIGSNNKTSVNYGARQKLTRVGPSFKGILCAITSEIKRHNNQNFTMAAKPTYHSYADCIVKLFHAHTH